MDNIDLYVESSGNVFEDLGFEDPEGELAKADLAIEIIKVIRARGLTQHEAAKIMGIQQPRVSEIMRGRLGKISHQALINYLLGLGQNVQVTVTSPDPVVGSVAPPRGSLSVRGAAFDEPRRSSPSRMSTTH